MGLKVFQVLSVLCAVQYGKAARWSHSAMLSPDYRLLWSLGPGPQDITFELQVRTLGYVGFGFSKDGRMTGADMVVGWVDKGQVYFQVSPLLDICIAQNIPTLFDSCSNMYGYSMSETERISTDKSILE